MKALVALVDCTVRCASLDLLGFFSELSVTLQIGMCYVEKQRGELCFVWVYLAVTDVFCKYSF